MSTLLDAEADGSYVVDGQRIGLPVEVRAARQAAATFLVRHAAAQRLIDHTGLQATRQRGGVAIASLALVDYTDNDLGSYKELALAVLVDDPDGPTGRGAPVSTLIHRLPVSETFTCLAGYGIWGFPKWVADLTVDFDDRGAVGVLRSDDGQEVVRVTMRRGPIPLPAKPMPMQAFTCADDGAVRATPWETRTSGRQHVRPGGTSVEIGYGHPIADELRALGLPKRALMTLFDDHMSATFGAPRIVAGVGRTLAT